jgi:GNAT superfamily N-acetyltransferase
MGISTPILRITEYYARHGFGATVRRAQLSLKRALVANRMVVFYCDLSQTLPTAVTSSSLQIDRVESKPELRPQDLEVLINLWNPKLAERNLKERFAKGASLWLIRHEGQLAGYCWTIRGRAIAPYYFPMGQGDVPLFDFYVIRKFRGGAILRALIIHILHTLKAEGATRAFGDAAEWNEPSLCFYKMIPFRRLGVARSVTIFSHKFTTWDESVKTEQLATRKESRRRARAVARPHER